MLPRSVLLMHLEVCFSLEIFPAHTSKLAFLVFTQMQMQLLWCFALNATQRAAEGAKNVPQNVTLQTLFSAERFAAKIAGWWLSSWSCVALFVFTHFFQS
jgi:hypothetical protein